MSGARLAPGHRCLSLPPRVQRRMPLNSWSTLVHEFQHIMLGGVLHVAPVHCAVQRQRSYAPWRDDPRPLGGLLQGVYA